MAKPQKYTRYCVRGYKIIDGIKNFHEEYFANGRDAYILHSYLKREGYDDVQILLR